MKIRTKVLQILVRRISGRYAISLAMLEDVLCLYTCCNCYQLVVTKTVAVYYSYALWRRAACHACSITERNNWKHSMWLRLSWSEIIAVPWQDQPDPLRPVGYKFYLAAISKGLVGILDAPAISKAETAAIYRRTDDHLITRWNWSKSQTNRYC